MDQHSGQFATINGLRMYYEIRGSGQPLLVLHGGVETLEVIEPLLAALAQMRRVIAPELEGHGRTVDLDRPLTSIQMASDVAGLLDSLGAGPFDILGYSLGGLVAQRIAITRPDLVRKLVVISAPYNNAGYYPATTVGWPSMSAETFAGSPFEQAYMRVAPQPERWPGFISKIKHTMMDFGGWNPTDIQSIAAPTLLAIGDADLVRPEAAVEMFRLLGGARPDGGMGPLPASQLAILPGTTHFTIIDRLDLLLPILLPFLDAPLPAKE